MNQKKVIVIGAGPAGLWAARTLQQNGMTPVVIEKNHQVGGKCSTFVDQNNSKLKTERGAGVLTPNYGSVIDAIHEKHINLERKIKTNAEEIPLYKTFKEASWATKLKLGLSLLGQMTRFIYDVMRYNHARDHLEALPEDLEISFALYAEKHGMNLLSELLKPVVTAFGYGAMEECPTYAVLQYMGIGTILYLAMDELFSNSSLLGIENGFQSLMEQVANDFAVINDAAITKVKRDESGVEVTYQTKLGETYTERADALVLAVSPLQWQSLGLEMTPVEQECSAALNYYRYPIAVCDVEGLPPEILYKEHGLNREGYGKLSLITTRDNRLDTQVTDGRLCTVYLNLAPGASPFEFNEATINALRNEIMALPGVTNVQFLEFKIWEDYMPTLPWELRLALEKEQMNPNTNTLYVGAYPVGGFEDVACVTEQAKQAVEKYLVAHNDNFFTRFENKVKNIYHDVGRVFTFYHTPRVEPVNDQALRQQMRC